MFLSCKYIKVRLQKFSKRPSKIQPHKIIVNLEITITLFLHIIIFSVDAIFNLISAEIREVMHSL